MWFRWRDSAEHAPTVTVVRRKPSLDFSVTGLVFTAMMLFMAIAAANSQANLLFVVFGLMVGTLLVSAIISRLVLRRLRPGRVLPELAVVGQPTTLLYEFENPKRYWPSLSVTLAELDGAEAFTRQVQCYLLHVPAGDVATAPTEAIPKRRGLHTLMRYQLSTSFPFGFIKRAVIQSQKDMILVYPAIARVDQRVMAMCRSADSTGAMMRPRAGGMDEFYGVKEYRQGNNPRFIYWRRSARTGVLVSKEMTQVAPPRLLLLVDTHVPLRTLAAHANVERAIAMAASLASQALETGLSVGLLAWTDEWTYLPPARGKRHRRELLTHLARLPLNDSHATDELLGEARSYVESGITPVLLTPNGVQVGLGDQLRSGLVVLGSDNAQISRLFQFPDTVDFTRCMPLEHEPPTESRQRRAGRMRRRRRQTVASA